MHHHSMHHQQGNAFIGMLILMLGSCIILFGIMVIAITSFVWSYKNLAAEDYVATLWFEPASSETVMAYTAHLATDQKSPEYTAYDILGDQWRLDARFLKMRWLAAAFAGQKSRYALSRLEGRYSNINDANRLPNKAHDIDEKEVLESFSIFGFNIFADISYGASVYQDIQPNTLYTVYKTTTGLLVRQATIPNEETPKSFWHQLTGS